MSAGFVIRPITPDEPAPAATVVLLRPGPDGLEVLLTHRPATMAFAAGVHVFPGGRLEPSDAQPDGPFVDGLTPAVAAARLAGTVDPSMALAYFAAAARETAEETGIVVAARDLVPLTRWVTPRSLSRRFDTRFFAVAVPAEATVVHGSAEVAAAAWMTPRAALEAASRGEIALLQPTHVTLRQLRDQASMAAVTAAFAPGARLDPPSIGAWERGVAEVDQRWAGGMAGHRATGWLVGEREVVLLDPADPTEETTRAVDVALAGRGARLVGIALTSPAPDNQAGVELYATGRGLPVVAGAGARAELACAVTELPPGARVPFGDIELVVERVREPAGPGLAGYRLRDGRRLPPGD